MHTPSVPAIGWTLPCSTFCVPYQLVISSEADPCSLLCSSLSGITVHSSSRELPQTAISQEREIGPLLLTENTQAGIHWHVLKRQACKGRRCTVCLCHHSGQRDSVPPSQPNTLDCATGLAWPSMPNDVSCLLRAEQEQKSHLGHESRC